MEPFSNRISTTAEDKARTWPLALLFAVLVVLAGTSRPGGVRAEDSTVATVSTPGAILVEADTLEVDERGGVVRASGAVVVEWDTSKLTAEFMEVDRRARRVEARGDVRYGSTDLVGRAESAILDVDSETGVLEDVELRLVGEVGHFRGRRIEKMEGRRLVLEDAAFTTCDTEAGHAPDWELRGARIDVRMDDYARIRGGSLAVRGVPVVYVPWVIFPTKQTRQSGLLSPSIGTSNRRGFLLTQPGFWAIDKHRDLTLSGVVETAARLGLDAEYRYVPSRRRWGRVHASYYNENVRGDAQRQIDSPLFVGSNIPVDRGALDFVHRERGETWSAYADVQVVSDDLFLREVDPLQGNAIERELGRSRRYTTSRVGALSSRGFASGGVDIVGYQDLVGSRRDTLHKPASAWLATDGAFGPFSFGIDSSLAAFARDRGSDGQRFDVATTLGMPIPLGERVRSRGWVTARGSAYAMNERDVLDASGAFVDRLDEFPTRGVLEAGTDLRTKLSRDFELAESNRFRSAYHSIEPFATLRYVSRSDPDEIPLFDGLDAIDGRDVATYGVDSRVFLRRRADHAKAAEGSWELARLSVMQGYNLTRPVVDDHFSDIDFAAFVRPVRGLALRTLTSVNVGTAEVRGSHASVAWETGPVGRLLPGPRSQVAAAYRFVRSDQADILESAEMLARLGIAQNVSIGLKGRYDLIGSLFVEKAAGITFTAACDCWSIGVGFIERVNPDEFQVRVAIELAGLGGFGSGATERTSPALDDVSYDDVGFWRGAW